MYELISATWLTILSAVLILYVLFWYKVHGIRRYVRSNASLRGKTVVITGANTGIGKEAAVNLAARGAVVIMACRNMTKAEEAAREIRRRSGNHNVLCRRLDLSSLESVRHFVDKFKQEDHRLDLLINNAGIGLTTRNQKTTKDGFHLVFGVNHFGHFLLTNLLIDKLKECSPSRVVTVSSRGERLAKSMILTPVEKNGIKYPGLRKYGQSKAANIMFARELSRRLEGTGVTSYSVSPGLSYTNIFANNFGPTIELILRPLLWLLMTSATTGAQTTIFCAVDEAVTSMSGRFFCNCQPIDIASPVACSDQLDKELWDISCQAVGVDEL